MNRNFGKLNDGAIEYGPDSLTIGGRKVYNPKAVHYRVAGYLPVVETSPTDPAPEGYHYERTGKYALSPDGQSVIAQYTAVPNPPPTPRRWTRLSIKTALATAGMLDAARQFLSTSEIATGYTAWEALTDCDYIEEGFGGAEKWSALLDGAAVALGKTREEIDAFLDAIPTEG
jgi:hypothetical protein